MEILLLSVIIICILIILSVVLYERFIVREPQEQLHVFADIAVRVVSVLIGGYIGYLIATGKICK